LKLDSAPGPPRFTTTLKTCRKEAREKVCTLFVPMKGMEIVPATLVWA
jgi:hypothetical protein